MVGGGLPTARSKAAEQGWEGPCRPLATGQKGRSCGAAKPELCTEPQPLSGTCPAKARAEDSSWSQSIPHPMLPSMVLVLTALQKGGRPGSHAGERLPWPERSEGAMGLEWGVEGGVREEPSTAGPIPVRSAARLVTPRDTGPVVEAQSSVLGASEARRRGILSQCLIQPCFWVTKSRAGSHRDPPLGLCEKPSPTS